MDAEHRICPETKGPQEALPNPDECASFTSNEIGTMDIRGPVCYGREWRHDGGEKLHAERFKILQECYEHVARVCKTRAGLYCQNNGSEEDTRDWGGREHTGETGGR